MLVKMQGYSFNKERGKDYFCRVPTSGCFCKVSTSLVLNTNLSIWYDTYFKIEFSIKKSKYNAIMSVMT